MSDARTTEASTADKRQSRIFDLVLTQGSTRVEALADEFNVSLVTMYRDITKLEELGLVLRDRGVISATTTSISEMPPDMREQSNRAAKQALAKAAISLVKTGNSVILDDSSTVSPLAQLLPPLAPLTLITNAQRITRFIEHERAIQLISTGGTYHRWSDSYHGSMTVQAIRQLHADICFMSDAAVEGDAVCNPYDFVSETKRAMLAAAKTRVLLVDSSKFTRTALHTTAKLGDFDVVIVDSDAPQEARSAIEDAGCKLLVAD